MKDAPPTSYFYKLLIIKTKNPENEESSSLERSLFSLTSEIFTDPLGSFLSTKCPSIQIRLQVFPDHHV